MKKIILCSTQRSGSTMVVEDMRNSTILGNPEEYFIRWQTLNESSNIDNEIDTLYKQGTKKDVFSIKVMASQIKRVNQLLETSTEFKDITDLFKDAYWVYIKRNDAVKQAVSRYIASVTKVNHAVEDEKTNHFAGNLLKGNYEKYNSEVPYDFDKIFKEYTNLNNENLFWEDFFKINNIQPLLLEYEIYSKYTNYEHIQQIAKYANISSEPTIVERKLKKLSNSINSQFVELFKADISKRSHD
ncbi:MAG: Stf0 family sulfotransferase [Bacteroidota bacterium]|nr:Stf0 family sulfotransferase [Bacteroidota bacterium]